MTSKNGWFQSSVSSRDGDTARRARHRRARRADAYPVGWSRALADDVAGRADQITTTLVDEHPIGQPGRRAARPRLTFVTVVLFRETTEATLSQ